MFMYGVFFIVKILITVSLFHNFRRNITIYKTEVDPNAEIFKNYFFFKLNDQIASIASNAKELYSRPELPR